MFYSKPLHQPGFQSRLKPLLAADDLRSNKFWYPNHSQHMLQAFRHVCQNNSLQVWLQVFRPTQFARHHQVVYQANIANHFLVDLRLSKFLTPLPDASQHRNDLLLLVPTILAQVLNHFAPSHLPACT